MKRFFSRTTLRAVLVLCGFGIIAFTGCDSLDALTNQEVDVPLGDAGHIPLAEGDVAESDTVEGVENVPSDAFNVTSIAYDASNMQYEPAPGKRADTGTAEVFLILREVPIVGATVSVQDDSISSVEPNPIGLGDGLDGLESCLDNIDNGDSLLRSDYTEHDKEEWVRQTLQQSSFQTTVAACVDGLQGELIIEKATVGIEVETNSSDDS